MTNHPLVLTFDCGTQSIRALLVDKDGNIVAKEQKPFAPYYSIKPGYAEQKPSVYRNAMKDVSRHIHEHNPSLVDDIIAVTITTIRDTVVCLDKNGQPIRDFIVWLDQREAKCETPLPFMSRVAFELVGMTGQLLDSVASQIGHIPFDFQKKRWFDVKNIKFPIFGVPPEKLINIVEPGAVLGTISKAVSDEFLIKENLPVIATGSDKGCETLGSGVLDNDMASLSFGTTATIQTTIRKYIEPQQFMPAYPGLVTGTYNPEIQIYRGFWMVSWFKKEFAEKEVTQAPGLGVSPEELLNRRLKEIPPGSDGLMLQPYWAPLLKSPEAKGSIIGFSGEHTRIHIYKAIIEGIGYGLIEGMKSLEKRTHTTIKGLTVSGGGSQSDEICQITADMFGKPVYKIQTYEACGLGSSMVAFVALGIYKDYPEAIAHMVRYTKTFSPDPIIHEIYDELYEKVYTKIYQSLKPLYHELRVISKKRKI
ncbi:MAG: FGGY-family carbohydrate kinase [Firmicutes bacterium]|nr:FGGY-family carbohydrate kinase [Bacillota bacterium]